MRPALRRSARSTTTSRATTRRQLLHTGLAAALGSALPLRAQTTAAADADAGPLRLATSTPGGGFALYGDTLQRVLNAQAGRPLLQARPTGGTAENLALLARGEVDAALVQGTVASEVLARPDAGGLRILWAMYPSPGLLAVPRAAPLQRLDDVRGRRIVFGVRGSGLVTLARQVFEGIGLDIDRDCEPVYVEQAAASPRLVLAGQAEGLWGAGEGWPGFVQLAQAPGGARFLGPDAAQLLAIRRRHPHLQAMTVAAGAYPGIDAPLPTVGSVNFILARPGLSAARAEPLLRALHAAAPALAAALPQAAFSTLENTRDAAPAPGLLHPALQAL